MISVIGFHARPNKFSRSNVRKDGGSYHKVRNVIVHSTEVCVRGHRPLRHDAIPPHPAHLPHYLLRPGPHDHRDVDSGNRCGKFSVAISDRQQQKIEFRIGDEVKGTAWPCINAKHDIADYYRAGGFKVLNRAEERISSNRPPFTGSVPALDVFSDRGARMLDSKRWSKKCFTCIWANKSALEIEYDFGKVKRYRKETSEGGH